MGTSAVRSVTCLRSKWPAVARCSAAALGLLGILVLARPVEAASTSIISAGALTSITISDELNCAVNHMADTSGEFFGDTACATEIAVGGGIYGPSSIPAGNSPGGYTPVSQSPVTGSGTSGDPYTIVTVVDVGTTGLRITETDSYVVGQEAYRTDVTVSNMSIQAQSVILYRGGDCYLQNSDLGFGSTGNPAGAVACVAAADPTQNPVPGSRIEQWVPLSSGSHYFEATYSSVWSAMSSQMAFPDTCDCGVYEDNGAGLSWALDIPPGETRTVSHLTNFSPLGNLALSTAKTADQASVVAGGQDGYTITVSNPNASIVQLMSISDTLPAGFTYVAGSSTGATTADPTVSSQTLTWNGPFDVPAASGQTPGSLSLHFNVTASMTPGTYMNNATADGGSFSVVPTGDTAPVTIVAAHADLSIEKTDAPDPVVAGSDLTYTLTVHNNGPDTAAAVAVADTLPAGVAWVSTTTSVGSCSGTTAISCDLGSLANGASATITIVVTPAGAGGLSNTATVSAQTDDPDSSNNSSTATTTVTAAVGTATATGTVTATATSTSTATSTVPPSSTPTVTDTPTTAPSSTPTQTPAASSTATVTRTATVTPTRPGAIPVLPSPVSPGGVALVAGLGAGLLWALRRLAPRR